MLRLLPGMRYLPADVFAILRSGKTVCTGFLWGLKEPDFRDSLIQRYTYTLWCTMFVDEIFANKKTQGKKIFGSSECLKFQNRISSITPGFAQ